MRCDSHRRPSFAIPFDGRGETDLRQSPDSVLTFRSLVPWMTAFGRGMRIIDFGPVQSNGFRQPNGDVRNSALPLGDPPMIIISTSWRWNPW